MQGCRSRASTQASILSFFEQLFDNRHTTRLYGCLKSVIQRLNIAVSSTLASRQQALNHIGFAIRSAL